MKIEPFFNEEKYKPTKVRPVKTITLPGPIKPKEKKDTITINNIYAKEIAKVLKGVSNRMFNNYDDEIPIVEKELIETANKKGITPLELLSLAEKEIEIRINLALGQAIEFAAKKLIEKPKKLLKRRKIQA